MQPNVALRPGVRTNARGNFFQRTATEKNSRRPVNFQKEFHFFFIFFAFVIQIFCFPLRVFNYLVEPLVHVQINVTNVHINNGCDLCCNVRFRSPILSHKLVNNLHLHYAQTWKCGIHKFQGFLCTN
jgi:hypothetical protein